MREVSTCGKPVSLFLMSQNATILAPQSPVPALLDSRQASETAIHQYQQEKPKLSGSG
jgi:hypothetical protein